MKRGVPKRDAMQPRPFSVKSSICNFVILTRNVEYGLAFVMF